MFEPTLNLFFRYVSTVGSKRRYHNSRVCVDVAGRDSCCFCTMFLYWCSEDRRPQLAISFESEPLSPANFHKPGQFCSSAATLARFFHVEIFWLVGESNTKFHVISLALRDRRWNELPANFKITWRHSNRPIRRRPYNNHAVWHGTKNRLKIIFMGRGLCMGNSRS